MGNNYCLITTMVILSTFISMVAGQIQNFTEEIETLTKQLFKEDITYFLPKEENFESNVATLGPSKFEKTPLEKPQIVILPKDENQVAKILNLTKNLNLPIGVRNGGHGNQGLSNPPGGIVIGMSNFKLIEIDEEKKIIQIGGGVNMQELNEALKGTGFWLPLADGGTVGYTGFLLHGGIDHYYGRFTGLASDLLLSATVALYDGKIIETDENNYADLFFALKGAGSIFGTVTKLTLQLVNVQNLSHDYFIYPYSEEILKKSILFVKEISEQFNDVQVCVYFLTVGIESDFLEITIAYNTTDNQLKQNIFNKLKEYIQIEFFESGKNLQPYEHLHHSNKINAPLITFMYNKFSDLRYFQYSYGFKYNYLTKENIDKFFNIYHKNQFIQNNNQQIYLVGGYYHSFGGKFNETDSLTGLKNVEIFGAIFEQHSGEKFYQYQQIYDQNKQFSRSEDGIFADVYANIDMLPFHGNFEKKIVGDFIGGEENLKKLEQLKSKYDPENFFTGHYFQQIFQEESNN